MSSASRNGTEISEAVPLAPADLPIRTVNSARRIAVVNQDTSGAWLGPPVSVSSGLPPRTRRRLRDYIEAHLREKHRVATLAAIAGFSRFHFNRAFKRTEGLSPHKCAFGQMPYRGPYFSDDQIDQLSAWITNGCPE
jgi:AraC-like DNA-binding protein